MKIYFLTVLEAKSEIKRARNFGFWWGPSGLQMAVFLPVSSRSLSSACVHRELSAVSASSSRDSSAVVLPFTLITSVPYKLLLKGLCLRKSHGGLRTLIYKFQGGDAVQSITNYIAWAQLIGIHTLVEPLKKTWHLIKYFCVLLNLVPL